MSDTQKRIAEYKQLLPGLKERIVAVALLLVISLTMVTTTTFAWVVLSLSPEVTGVTTTVAANGNLEIALAKPDGSLPGESAIGDSFATEGQSIAKANVTWGNLINLNDPSYGLDNLVLRPAQLNTASLLTSPLYGAEYGEDGRIIQLDSSFAYTTWNPPEGDKPGYFGVSEDRGVRAISSTKIEAVGAEALYVNKLTNAKNANLAAANMYKALGSNTKYMPSLATMMGLYMTARMNPDHATLSNPDCAIADIQNLRDMYAAFLECFDQEAAAMAALVNLQLFLILGDGNYTPYTTEMIYATTTAKLKAEGLQITDLDQFIKDRNTIASDYEKLVTIAESGTSLKWKDSGLNAIVNNLVDVGKCTIGADNTPISSIGASNALGYLSGTQEARITNGILYRFEERTGGYIEVKNLGISATVNRMGLTIPATVKANIQTTAPRDYNLFQNDQAYAESLNDGTFEGGIPVAEDTFGLAIDFWVRTNAVGHYLVLQGNVLTKTETIDAMGTDLNGNEVQLYTLTRKVTDVDGNDISVDLTLYMIESEGENGAKVTTWYNHDTHTVESLSDGETPTKKIIKKEVVIGYEGDNRVWDESAGLSINSTTQGSGSCYVYYADTPEDQARSLKLLQSMNVAFVDDKGKLMATAIMDTEHHYAANGKVIVPLVLNSMGSINLGENIDGDTVYAITALEKNVPTMVTAIVYLEGSDLTNDDVLAAADIQGQLNIQFGAYENDLENAEDEELKNQYLTISAELDKTKFNFDVDPDLTTNVTVTVDGDQPNTMTAFFLREINSTQGSREEVMTFTKNADGKWSSSYKFTAPGNYVLRSIRLDGAEHDLETPLSVEIEGFTVENLTWEFGSKEYTFMTADGSRSVDVYLKFASNDASKLPKTVQGRFLREDGTAANINFVYNSTTQQWAGTATFVASGTYTLQYLVLDGEYTELDVGFQKTAKVYLGMRAAVYTTSPHKFKYVPAEMTENQKNLAMQIKILDNAGNEMLGLSGVKLTYGMKGSGIKTMDVDLTWNGSYYVGDMINGGPGIWQFKSVTVGGNTLTNATTSPTFTIQSPEPPEYYAHSTGTYQYKPNNDAVMDVQITNSEAASVQAYIIKDGAASGVWVTGTLGGNATTPSGFSYNHWSFEIPKDGNGYQDGNWTLTELRLWDVFAADGTAYTEESPLKIDVSDTNNVTKVVSRIYVTFDEGQSKDFGKDGDTVTGTFMQSHTVSGLSVDIKDFAGGAMSNVTDVTLTFTYVSGSSSAKGGYSSNSLTNATDGAVVTVKLDKKDGTKYSQSTDATILYAGEYTTTLSFKVGSTTYTYTGTRDDSEKNTKALPANAPVFTVSSKKPTVTVTGISPTGTINVHTGTRGTDGSVTYNQTISGNFNTMTEYSAVVFLAASSRNVNEPEVKLTLSGMPANGFTASMVFPNGSSSSYNKTYEFTANNQEKSQNIGGKENGSGGFLGFGATDPKIFPAGKQTVSKISVVYNNITFTVNLSHEVTISQPQIPVYANFVINEASYSGSVPEKVYSADGEKIVLTLPDADDVTTMWTENKTDSSTSTFAEQSHTTTTYYETWNGGCDGDQYQQYVKHIRVSQADETVTTYVRTWRITGWKVGNTTYALGETITLTGSQEISAVLSYTDGAKTSTVNIITRTTKYFEAGSETNGTPPTGYVNVTTDPDNGNKDRWTESNPNVSDVRTPKN